MARASVRQLWKAKLEGRLASSAWPEPEARPRVAFVGRVLGIDPAQASARAREIEASSTDVDANAAMAEAMLAALERDVPRRPKPEPRAEPRSLEQQREHDAALRAARERFGDAPARTWSAPALRSVGYRVERGRDGWTLKHADRELADKIPTESAAWEYAAQLQTPQE